MEVPRVGVGVFVLKDGKFLMGQRKGSHGAGSWSVPGGWLEYGESFEQAAVREVAEETGLEVDQLEFAAITNNIFLDEGVHSLTVWMTGRWKSGEPQILEPDKFISQRWADLDSLPEPLFLPWESLLKSEFIETIRKKIAQTAQGEDYEV